MIIIRIQKSMPVKKHVFVYFQILPFMIIMLFLVLE